jgi:hypothetical protein
VLKEVWKEDDNLQRLDGVRVRLHGVLQEE